MRVDRQMPRLRDLTWPVLLSALTFACSSTTPPPRLVYYVGQDAISESTVTALPEARPISAALVLVFDASSRDAGSPLPDEAMRRLGVRLQQELSERLPVVIDRILPPDGIEPGGGTDQLVELGRRHGIRYLLFVVASSTEREYPMTLFLGWVSHSQPGWRRDNWSLLEVLLVDVESGQTLLRAEGRGWATLDRPAAPGINQWYPVVWLRPQDPARRYWPSSYEGAPNTLRVVAMHEAAKRLLLNLQESWIHKRRIEIRG